MMGGVGDVVIMGLCYAVIGECLAIEGRRSGNEWGGYTY